MNAERRKGGNDGSDRIGFAIEYVGRREGEGGGGW